MAIIDTLGGRDPRALALYVIIACASQTVLLFLAVGITKLFVRLGRRFFFVQKIQPGAGRSVARYELKITMLNAAFSSGLLLVTAYFLAQGWIRVHFASAGAFTILLECAAYIAGLDVYSYFIHRLMHTRLLFRNVHYVHHRSKTPNALSAFSFHPVEWTVLGLYFPLALWIVEPHALSVALLGVVQLFMSSFPHCGYEYVPSWWYTNRVARCFLTPFFHDIHHQRSIYNFGGVTTLWDRLFKTISPDFEREFRAFRG